jgi:hypothetical protein
MSSGPGKSALPIAIEEKARKNQNTITLSRALTITSSLCQLLFCDIDFSLETRNFLKKRPKTIPKRIVTSGSIHRSKFAGI